MSTLFINPRIETTFVRAVIGLVMGTIAAAATTVLLVIVLSKRASGEDLSGVVDGLFIFFVTSSLTWAFGLFTVGATGWAILHRMSVRGPLAAVLLGAALPGGLAMFMVPDPTIWGPFAVAGGLAGLVIQAVSYRPVPETKA